MDKMTKKVEPTGEVCIRFTEDEMQTLNLIPGTKLSVAEGDDGAITLTPYKSLEVDISEWSREVLEMLITESCEQDISINEVIQKRLEKYLEA
jgi:hypothetical protein